MFARCLQTSGRKAILDGGSGHRLRHLYVGSTQSHQSAWGDQRHCHWVGTFSYRGGHPACYRCATFTADYYCNASSAGTRYHSCATCYHKNLATCRMVATASTIHEIRQIASICMQSIHSAFPANQTLNGRAAAAGVIVGTLLVLKQIHPRNWVEIAVKMVTDLPSDASATDKRSLGRRDARRFTE